MLLGLAGVTGAGVLLHGLTRSGTVDAAGPEGGKAAGKKAGKKTATLVLTRIGEERVAVSVEPV